MSEDSTVLSPEEVARLLEATARMFRTMSTLLPDNVVAYHPGDDEWCFKEVLGHLIEAEERGFAGRIRTILREDHPALVGWDQVAVARDRRDCEKDFGAMANEFISIRRASVDLVAGLSESELLRGGQHPAVGWLTVGDLLQEWVFHDQNHVRQALSNVQGLVWPHMGNAQRFYQDE